MLILCKKISEVSRSHFNIFFFFTDQLRLTCTKVVFNFFILFTFFIRIILLPEPHWKVKVFSLTLRYNLRAKSYEYKYICPVSFDRTQLGLFSKTIVQVCLNSRHIRVLLKRVHCVHYTSNYFQPMLSTFNLKPIFPLFTLILSRLHVFHLSFQKPILPPHHHHASICRLVQLTDHHRRLSFVHILALLGYAPSYRIIYVRTNKNSSYDTSFYTFYPF